MPKMDDEQQLTHAQLGALAMQAAHGKAHVLVVGVGENLKSSTFKSLKTCVADAEAVRDAFAEVRQLNADPPHLKLLTTKMSEKPSRGVIREQLKELADGATKDDRIIFFFSGHGHRLDDKLFLVPSDADDPDDPTCLVDFDFVTATLNSSEAKQKIVVLDACFSGPDTSHLKLLPKVASTKFLTEYIKKTTGVVVFSSSESSQTSSTKSPHPNLSRFTHFFVKGLRGEAAALSGHFLTVPSLFAYVSQQVLLVSKSHGGKLQSPALSQDVNGVIMLADFTPRISSVDELDIGEAPVSMLEFEETESQDVRDILTNIKNWHYSMEWIELKANSALDEFVKADLGVKKVALRKAMSWTPADITVVDAGLEFPAGSYTIKYEASDKKSGQLVHCVTFEPEWFGKSDAIPAIITALGLSPRQMRLVLSKPCQPQDMLPGLEADGWDIQSELEHELKARKERFSLVVTDGSITFGGLVPSDIFGSAATKERSMLAMKVLALLPAT